MATLADAFLEDFDEEDEQNEEESTTISNNNIELNDEDFMDLDDVDLNEKSETSGGIFKVSKLYQSAALNSHLDVITDFMKKEVDEKKEFKIIVVSNELVVEIGNDINTIHKYLLDLYAPRFSELEQLVKAPVEFANVVKTLGNGKDLSEKTKELENVVAPNNLMIISITATTSTGSPLSEEIFTSVLEACHAIIELNNARIKIENYIESRMNVFAPNLSSLLKPNIAAKLITHVGGLEQLCKIPSSNIKVIGAPLKNKSLSTSTNLSNRSIIGYCDIVTSAAPSCVETAVKLVSNKTALAARCDIIGSHPGGEVGSDYRDQILARLEKKMEPPPNKPIKPLPIPRDKPSQKRGGKRARRMKAKFEQTDIQKQRNRISFGIAEDEYQDSGVGFGTLGISGGGNLRVKTKDTQKLKVLGLKKITEKKRRYGGTMTSLGASTSGTSTSLAFTPVQGLELLNPNAEEKKDSNENVDYFSTTSQFIFKKSKV